ncbi:type III secretion system outer membrane ring subunit SctC [Aquabacterium sp. A7-Y]|uniref:type III secretion system outer membrane ring subunit SctC n=1 Tax=Aquabacterium sp. A7-Y TaxID=1349605 RepID=UPI00223D3269|nr:type III secretion system outer membrane ring subunit SctC [Aquabacterium sp. A7-Y]MCW7536998.1 type III secretion system outer membrane ring subunit SctC [Aquabacterium sp. A7-Y]
MLLKSISAAVAVCLGTFTSAAVAAPPPSWNEAGTFAYRSDAQPLRRVLEDFARHFGASLEMSIAGDAVVRGRYSGATPQEFLDKLALSYQFNWFIYNNQLHVSPLGDRVTERVLTGETSPSEVREALQGIGLFEAKFGWGELQNDGAVLVSGPRAYVERVRTAITGESEADGEGAMVFKLRYAFLEDRVIEFRNKRVVVPGVVSVLRNLAKGGKRGRSGGVFEVPPGEAAGSERGSRGSVANQLVGPLLSAAAGGGEEGGSAAAPRRSLRGDLLGAGLHADAGPAIEPDVRTNAVIIRDDPSKRAYYRSLIAQLDVPQQLVEIEAMIIDVERNRLRELGIDWSATFGGGRGTTRIESNNMPASQKSPGPTLVINNFSYFLSRILALESEGDAAIIGKPAVMTMENLGAVIDLSETVYLTLVGERVADAVPITAGTMLRVTPTVIREGSPHSVQLMIDIEDGKIVQSEGTRPTVARSTVSTQTIVEDNQSLVIAGYNYQQQGLTDAGVPGVRRVPLMGRLFSSQQKEGQLRERLFIITPRAVRLQESQRRASGFAQLQSQRMRADLRPTLTSPDAATPPQVPPASAPGPAPIPAPAASGADLGP